MKFYLKFFELSSLLSSTNSSLYSTTIAPARRFLAVILLGCSASALSVFCHAAEYAAVAKDEKAAVATVNPIATKAALDAISAGGNAIDAALAAAFTLGVVDSHNSGIGGGCFIVARLASGEIIAIDGREMAPAAAHRDMYLVDGKLQAGLSRHGALAIGVPGSVAALNQFQKQSGKLKFEDVLLPAADIAEKGFEIDAVLAARLSRTHEHLAKFEASKAIFLRDGTPLVEGETLVQKDLAHTYRELAKEGPDYFYKGKFAAAVDEWMRDNKGIVTKKDFANYKVIARQPVSSEYLGYTLYGFPPPSSGGVHVSQILNILENFDLAKLSEADRYHLIIEASKLAFADRAYWLGDGDFVNVPKGLTSKKYAKTLAKKISLEEATAVESFNVPPSANEDFFNKHTTHIATADAEGNWVSITTTLNTSFGSKVTIPGTGVLMNNQMDDFSAQPGVPNAFGLVGSEANRIEAKKRPLSSMSPTIVLKDGKPLMSLGAAGGPTIISQVVETLLNHIAMDMPLDKALEATRVHHQWQPNFAFIEASASDALIAELKDRGHQIRTRTRFGASQAISVKSGKFEVESEPRIQ